MRKYLFLLMTLLMAALVLVACGNANADSGNVNDNENINDTEDNEANADDLLEEVQEDNVRNKTVSEQEHDIELADNEDLKFTLSDSRHEIYEDSDIKDEITMNIKVENKKDRTFDLFVKSLSLDGMEIDNLRLGIVETEIGPKETKVVKVVAYTERYLDDFDISLSEHIKGIIWYNDYEGNRNEIEFNEYINE